MDAAHDLAALLADDTRYRICRFVAEHPGGEVVVADVAAAFGLHPNVARMHLTKLAQAGLLATGVRRSPAGGRPARTYRLGPQVLDFTFPPRRYELLARLALAGLAASGDSAVAAEVAREAGRRQAAAALAGRAAPADPAAVVALARRLAAAEGLFPAVAWHDGRLTVTVRNCVFREAAGTGEDDLVCLLHRSFLAGLLETAAAGLGRVAVDGGAARIRRGDGSCVLECRVAAGGSGTVPH